MAAETWRLALILMEVHVLHLRFLSSFGEDIVRDGRVRKVVQRPSGVLLVSARTTLFEEAGAGAVAARQWRRAERLIPSFGDGWEPHCPRGEGNTYFGSLGGAPW
jgi:hypothetical protein